MSTSRIVGLSFIALISLWQQAAGETIELGKFRAVLTSGERIEGHSGVLTEDGLSGTLEDGNGTSIPAQSIRTLHRSAGTHATTVGVIGAALGFAYAMVDLLEADSETHVGAIEIKNEDTDILDLAICTIGGGLAGIAVGSFLEKWQKVPVSSSVGFLPERREVRFQLSLAF